MTDGREAAREPGELVRDVWVAWAREQPDVADHASWTVAWEALSARDREVDARIEATIRRDERERASESALRAAAQALLDNDRGIGCSGCIPPEEGYHTPECLMGALSIALAGAPWEPSEAMVERLGYWLATRDGEALSYEWGRDGTGPDGGVYRDYTTEARAALKAAFSPGGSPSGTGQQQTGH